MPYHPVVADEKGYVIDDNKTKEKFSKKPLTKPKPKKSYSDKTGKPAGIFFK